MSQSSAGQDEKQGQAVAAERGSRESSGRVLNPRSALHSTLLRRQLPNALTAVRIAFIPLIVAMLLSDWWFSNQTAAIAFILAGITDVSDGYVARRFGSGSQLGIFFDLVGDKLLAASVLFAMVALGWMAEWLAMGFVAREIIVMGLRAYAGGQGVTVSAGRLGKAKMMWQYIAFIALVWERSDIPWMLLVIAFTLTVVSGVHYAVGITRELRARPAPAVPDVI